jgi:hypothetical protein
MGFVYVIGAENDVGPVKVGVAENLRKRLRALQGNSPAKLPALPERKEAVLQLRE